MTVTVATVQSATVTVSQIKSTDDVTGRSVHLSMILLLVDDNGQVP